MDLERSVFVGLESKKDGDQIPTLPALLGCATAPVQSVPKGGYPFYLIDVSTHAPARGATAPLLTIYAAGTCVPHFADARLQTY